MTTSLLAFMESLRIGTVDFVSPDEIKVLLELDAPDTVALNSGSLQPFPRVNGYLLIPCDGAHLVGQVEWITVERSPYPKRKGLQDFGLIDLPYPLRKVSLSPLGMLRAGVGGDEVHKFQRGVDSYPSVGQPVLLPTSTQLRFIVESGEHRRVWLGNSPLAANARVSVDPDRLFGRHVAVLGNTGSGKSCSVAGIIRWSLDAAHQEVRRKKRTDSGPNARFIVLDPNGEYGETFADMQDSVTVTRFAVEPRAGEMQLHVPIWLWNADEWCAFTQAAPKVQRPILIQALRAVRDGSLDETTSRSTGMRRYLRVLVAAIRLSRAQGDPFKGSGPIKGFRDRLKVWTAGLNDEDEFTEIESGALRRLVATIDSLLQRRSGDWPNAFERGWIDELLGDAQAAHSAFGATVDDALPIDPNSPRPFSGEQLLRSIEAHAELLNQVDHVETMLMRVKTLISDARMREVLQNTDNVTLEGWLDQYLGHDSHLHHSSGPTAPVEGVSTKAVHRKAAVTIIDLSLLPSDVVHVVASVIARMTLEAHQRYRKVHQGAVLPTVLVMEEAHTFVKRYSEDAENPSTAAVCCQVFERIAREGRKFGVGLVLSSQRPSELSPTVLSQCNTFLLHRISNDRDQELVQRLVPDNLRGLLRDLPSLPARQAVLLGWASELPTLVEMRHLPEHHRPKSNDPDFWQVWTRERERSTKWAEVAADWIGDEPATEPPSPKGDGSS